MQAQPIGKRSILVFLALSLIHFFGSAQNADTPYRMKTIVIDAGHGGNDPGNLGTGRYKTREKDIALDVALRVGGYIKTQFPEINVIYTRSTDVFIGLNERADIANKAKADLFISIHCNAAANKSAIGVETFTLGLHRNQENLEVAMKENSAIFLEADYKTKYEGFDPNSAESIIALTIMQSAYLQQSLSISSYIQQQFKTRVGRRDRGVKQAGFLVLRRTTMPSVLIELGFLTNADEEDFLNSENGKSYMSSAIFRGFKEYKELVEDPLPEGYVPEAVNPADESSKQKELDEKMKAAEKAKQDSAQKAADQAKIKAVADSLERRKQQLISEKAAREAELAQQEENEKAKLKAKADSLETVKQQKLEEMKKRQAEIEIQKAKEAKEEAERLAKLEAEKKAKQEAERLAKEEEERKAKEAKENAKEWLEEIKAEKERELAEAKKQAAIDAEKERLEAIKAEKLKQLEEARKKAEEDSISAIELQDLQARKEQAKLDSIATAESKAKAAADSIKLAEEKKQAEIAARNKVKQDSIAAVRKAEAEALSAEVERKKTTSPEEAELLFLQLRKKQLEQRIAQLRGQSVTEPTVNEIEERAAAKPEPAKKVNDAPVSGLVLRVQVITSANPLSSDSPQFQGQKVWEYQQGGLYKYTVGSTQDFEEITKLQSELRDLGFKGAFVVAFKDGERIKVSEAREMLNTTE